MTHSKQTYIYKTAQDCQIRADVYRASGKERRPTILWLHGGALIFGDRRHLPPEQRRLYLAAGYTVVSADYRLAPEAKLGAILEDVRDAYGWSARARARLPGVDPDRIAVMGHSAGGYLTLMAGSWSGHDRRRWCHSMATAISPGVVQPARSPLPQGARRIARQAAGVGDR
jgi:acetyl esterase/lipase